jgi:hypothetical protein
LADKHQAICPQFCVVAIAAGGLSRIPKTACSMEMRRSNVESAVAPGGYRDGVGA